MKRRAPTIRRCEALQRALKKSLLNVLSNARFNAELRLEHKWHPHHEFLEHKWLRSGFVVAS